MHIILHIFFWASLLFGMAFIVANLLAIAWIVAVLIEERRHPPVCEKCGEELEDWGSGKMKCFNPDCPLPRELVCEFCGGTGEVSTMEPVYAGEAHMAPIWLRACVCQIRDEDEYDGQDVD